MNLSISNIAWDIKENTKVINLLKKENLSLDIAPTKIFDSRWKITLKQISDVRENYKFNKVKLIAMQSLLYNTPSYSLFDGKFERDYILNHLKKCFFIAKRLGIKRAVFGSPKNRYINSIIGDPLKIALPFFRKVCNLAKNFKIDFCLEANPKEYGCNFITNNFEAIDFIKKVNMKNFLLNLDTSTVVLNKNKLNEILGYSKDKIGHIHLSAPYLKGISNLKNKEISESLKLIDYKGYICLEMKPSLDRNNINYLSENITIFKKFYS